MIPKQLREVLGLYPEVPVEIRYQGKIPPFDYITLKRVFQRGMVITRKDFFINDPVIGIPACFFLPPGRRLRRVAALPGDDYTFKGEKQSRGPENP